MAEVAISLQHRLQKRILLLVSVTFLIITLIILLFIEALSQSSVEEKLVLKHQVVEQVFNSYLAHAEDEISLIGQDLSLSDYEPGRELDLLFSHHEVLFFGALDFFYIEWEGRRDAMDPRARLFTEVEFKSILQQGLINRWVSVFTDDGSILLMQKKKILSESSKNMGFLYGFISLNDNLTLTSELLDRAKISAVRIYDKTNKKNLLEGSKGGVVLSESILSSSLPLKSSIQTSLQLDISQGNVFSFTRFVKALPFITALGVILFVFYLLLIHRIKKSIFEPLDYIASRQEGTLLPFIELQLIQLKNNQDKAFIEAKDSRFKLLAESSHCAVIFCNEVTDVEMINAEGRMLFPDSDKARSVFDFMPLSCHQAIQEALKGDIGVTFDLTIGRHGYIYKWQAYSFINESSYQGLLLVGRNITKETSLIWQLEQLQPLFSIERNKVDSGAILNELTYLSTLPHYISTTQLQGWLSLLISVFDDISHESKKITYLPIGDVLAQESAQVMMAMGVEVNRALLNCSLDVGVRVIAVSPSLRGLMRILFMMVMSNDMAERHLNVRFNNEELELTAMHDMSSRPLFFWMIKMLLAHLDGEQKILQNNALQLSFITQESEEEGSLEALPSGQVVAWVANDYPNAHTIREILIRLGLKVEEYASTDSFFTQSSKVTKFDAVLIGCDKAVDSQLDMTRALKLKYNRDLLPIIWLNSIFPAKADPDVLTLLGCPCDYSLHQVLVKACELDGIVPSQSSNKNESWIIVGGSRVSKAIWYTELSEYDISTQWLADLSNYHVVLSYHSDALVVLLESQTKELLQTIETEFPNVRLFSVHRWEGMPNNVALCEMTQPYSGHQIKAFTQNIMQKIENSE